MKSVDTVTELQRVNPKVDPFVFVSGYHEIGDGGGGFFAWEATVNPSVDNGIVLHSTISSGQWKRLFQPGEYWVDWWGARGDGTTDDAPAIQAAINYLLEPINRGYNRGGTLLFSSRKNYRCLSPLIIFDPHGYAVSIALKGATPAYVVGGAPVLFFDFNDKPGIIIQSARVVHLENLTLSGVNDYSAQLKSDHDWALDSNYINRSVAPRTNRYSPYAAISIDSFENTIERANQYPGLDKLYTNGPGHGSKQIYVKNCVIQNWYVGIMINSSAANPQADSCFIYNNTIQSCTFGTATGQSQSRGVDLRDNEFIYCKVAVDWGTFGQREGTPPHLTGGLLGGVKYLCLAGPNGTGIGNLEITGVYAELICSLGVLAVASHPNNMPAVFNACQFYFHKSDPQPEAVLITGGNVKFVGCSLATLSAGCFYFQTLKNNSSDSPSIEFDNTSLRTTNPNSESQIYVNAFTHARWKNASTFDAYWDRHIDSSECHPLTDDRKVNSISAIGRKLVTPGEVIHTSAGIYRVDFSEGTVPIGPNHNIKFEGKGRATLTLPGHGLFKIGDIVRGAESNPPFSITVQEMKVNNITLPKVGVIARINGNTATLIEVPSYFETERIPLRDLEVAYMKRYHEPTTGDVTRGSTEIANCAVTSGLSLTNAWFEGNRISGAGIPRGAYVTKVSGTTLTISAPAIGTSRHTSLYDAVVAQPVAGVQT